MGVPVKLPEGDPVGSILYADAVLQGFRFPAAALLLEDLLGMLFDVVQGHACA